MAELIAKPLVADPLPLDTLRQYSALMSELGVDQGIIQKSSVRRVLSEQGVCVYDEQAVTRYLNRTYGLFHWPSRPTWGWRGLRFTDCSEFSATLVRRNGMILTRAVYQLPVPMPVLMKVRDLSQSLREYRPHFFVSDAYQASDDAPSDLDPFLLLVCGRGEETALFRGVIERWDEPGFQV